MGHLPHAFRICKAMTSHRLLAMGDSLTAGYCEDGRTFAPWAPVLREVLDVADVDHIGLSRFMSQQMIDHARA